MNLKPESSEELMEQMCELSMEKRDVIVECMDIFFFHLSKPRKRSKSMLNASSKSEYITTGRRRSSSSSDLNTTYSLPKTIRRIRSLHKRFCQLKMCMQDLQEDLAAAIEREDQLDQINEEITSIIDLEAIQALSLETALEPNKDEEDWIDCKILESEKWLDHLDKLLEMDE